MDQKDYIVIVQCDISMQRCSGYACEKAFIDRAGGFGVYAADKTYRALYLTCGGCCGKGLHRKLKHLIQKLEKKENIAKDRIVVQLATCITKASHHGPACPHLDLMKDMIGKLGLDYREDTSISRRAEERRAAGIYGTPSRKEGLV